MNRYSFHYGQYMNGFVFSLRLVYEDVIRGLQPHVRTKNNGKSPLPSWLVFDLFSDGIKQVTM